MARKKRTLSEVLDDDTMTDYEKYKWYINRSNEWKLVRDAVFERDDYHCMCCGRTEADTISGNPVYLTVHHNSYENLFFEADNDYKDLITVCPLCHRCIHQHPGNKRRFRMDE